MPNIDPADMATRWRYRVDQDFTSRGGTPASWANDHPRFWGTEARCKVMGEYIMSASLNADSTLLALAHNDTVQVLSAKDLAVQQILRGSHGMGEVRSVAFHPHHPLRLVSEASPPDEEATLDPSCRPLISFWDLTFQGELQERGTLDGALFQDCPFNSSGSQMAYWGGEGSYEIWICSPFIDQDNMQYLGSFSAYLVCIGFATDDITLKTGQQQCCEVLAAASTDGEIQVWDARTLERKRRIQTEGRLFAAAITPSGKRLATVTINGPVKIWNLLDGLLVNTILTEGCPYPLLSFSHANDGHLIAAGGEYGKIEISDSSEGSLLKQRSLNLFDETWARDLGLDVQYTPTSVARVSRLKFIRSSEQGELRELLGWQLCLDGGLELYDLVNDTKWRFAAPFGEKRGQAIDWFCLGESQGVITVNHDSVRKWFL